MLDLNYKKKRQLLIILIYSLILVLFVRGLQLHLSENVTDRLRFHAIPIAISTLYHHHPHDYAGWSAIELPFQGSGDLKDLIKTAVTQDLKNDATNYYWVADDRGFADFVIASFYLFGPHLNSMYYMWFLVLTVSVSLFLLSFHKQLWALGFLGLILLGMNVAISTLLFGFVLTPTLSSLFTLSLYEPRFLDVLALVSVFHMIFFASRAKGFKWLRDGGPLMGQIFLFICLYHSRTSLGWELVAIFSYCFLHIFMHVYKKRQWKNIFTFQAYDKVRSATVVVMMLSCSLLLLNVYKHVVYNPKYFTEMGVRTFWHNALMGLGSDSFLANTYGLSISDFAVAQSVIHFAQTTNRCTSDIQQIEPQILLNSLGNWGVVDWVHYEHCAKKHFLSIFSNNKLRMVKLYLITKPLEAFSVIKTAMEKTDNISLEKIRNQYGIKWAPFNTINLCFLVVLFSLSWHTLSRNFKKIIFITLLTLLTAFIPSVVFYPGILTEGGVITVLPIFLYLTFFMIIYQLTSWLLPKQSNKINIHKPWMKKKKLSIIIPAFNEEMHISITIREVSNAAKKILDEYEIIVIDDGSTDTTYAKARDASAENGSKIRVLRHFPNKGVGAAFFTGLEQAVFPQLCLIPGDNAYNKKSIELLFSQCGLTPVVISYRQNMEERTMLRYVLSRIATLFLRIITGFKINDAHSLFLFPVEETRRLQITSVGYGYHMEILSRLLNRLKSYTEIPVILNPRPDANSGLMKPKTLLILGSTLIKLFGFRLIKKL